VADNAIIANPGAGGVTFASDQIGGIEYPRSKIVWGVDGVATDASATDPLPVTQARSATAATTQVGDNAASVTLLAANANRRGVSIQNDSSGILYLKCGTTATITDYTVRMARYDYWESPFGYTGRIDAIWGSDPNDGGARITEFT
jgi:hypothetical protein